MWVRCTQKLKKHQQSAGPIFGLLFVALMFVGEVEGRLLGVIVFPAFVIVAFLLSSLIITMIMITIYTISVDNLLTSSHMS